jgi:hypothetical protein
LLFDLALFYKLTKKMKKQDGNITNFFKSASKKDSELAESSVVGEDTTSK